MVRLLYKALGGVVASWVVLIFSLIGGIPLEGERQYQICYRRNRKHPRYDMFMFLKRLLMVMQADRMFLALSTGYLICVPPPDEAQSRGKGTKPGTNLRQLVLRLTITWQKMAFKSVDHHRVGMQLSGSQKLYHPLLINTGGEPDGTAQLSFFQAKGGLLIWPPRLGRRPELVEIFTANWKPAHVLKL